MSKNVAVFVDVANIFYAAKAAGVDIDYVTLLKSASAGRDLVRAYAYTGLDPENENQRNFHSFLARHGYRVVSKDIRKYGDGKVKANLDIELVVDMMKTARNLDIAIVVSGDGDFAPAIRAVQEMGVRVEVISFRGNTSSDLMDVADQFTDITQLAKVEKGSSRSGRRVAQADDEDLSMTEVPDKQTEGSGAGRGGRGGRGGRDRTRTRDSEPVERAVRGGRRAAAPAPAPAAVTSSGAPLVVLPGEKLSRVAPAAVAASSEEDVAPEVLGADEGALRAFAGGAVAEDQAGDEGLDANGRRRRRRGGRGRGRGRGRGEGAEATRTDADSGSAAVDDEAEAEAEYVASAPRGPRTTPFGSVWDSQLGVPSASTPSGVTPLTDDDEDLDEPEIPEYLIAEQRRNRAGRGGPGGGGNRGRGGARGGYAAAVERERYGGGGGGGINRYPDVSQRERQARDAGYGRTERPDRGERRDRPDRQPARSGGGDPWSEVPPEIEEMLRAQLATSRPRTVAPAAAQPGPEAATDAAAGSPAGEGASPEESAPAKRRVTRRRTAATATDVVAPVVEDSADPAEAAAPKRRATRRKAGADTAATDTAAVETTAPEAPAAKRRTRRTAASATADGDGGPGDGPAAPSTADASSAEAPAAAKRRATRRKASDATD